MANKKITALNNLPSPAGADILPIVDDVAGTPTTKKVTATNLMTLAPVQSVAGRTGTVTLSNSDISGLGTAAVADTGTSNGNVVVLDGVGLPAVNGSQLTNLPASSSLPTYASTNRPASPSTGDIIYETDTGRISVYDANSEVWRYWTQDGSVDPNEIVNNYSTQYDATDDLGTASIASNSMSGDFTLSFWMNGASTSNHMMLSSNYGYADGWGLMRKTANKFHIYYYYSGGSGWLYQNVVTDMSNDAWTHIMLARTGTSLKTYVAGSLKNTTTLSNNISFSGGTLVTNESYRSASYLDEVAVWSSDQSSNISEIRSAANKPKNLNAMSTKPLYWWRMGDDNSGTGTTISNNSNATGGTVNWLLTNGASINSSVKP